MIRLWDYRCDSCGAEHRDYPYDSAGHVPETIICPCGGRASWMAHRRNFIHPTASGMKYGTLDPQFGCVVEDYSHRQRLLRQTGQVEVGGPERQSAIDEDLYEATHRRRAPRDPGIVTADSMEEITALIDPDRVDRRASGPPRPMSESWGAFEESTG